MLDESYDEVEYLKMVWFADDPDLEEFQAAIEESKLQTSVQCTPVPGDYKFTETLIIAVIGHVIISNRDLKENEFLLSKVMQNQTW